MRILFFGQLKAITGKPEMQLSFGADSADDLWRELIALHPSLSALRSQIRLAQNGEFASPSARFSDSDEIALIPPVSGG
jgi:molybdopterin converting factor subunit 1